MRLVVGIALVDRGVVELWNDPTIYLTIFSLLRAGAGLFLLAGLWTPVVGAVVAIIEVWKIFSHLGDPWIHILLGTFGAALALIGPGAWSVDAYLFGWKRINIPPRKS